MKKSLLFVLSVIVVLSMALTAFADVAFVPSVEAKLAPEAVPSTDESAAVATVYDSEDNVIATYDLSGVIVTPLAAADKAADVIEDILDSAYDELKDADSLADIITSLPEAVKEYNPNYSADDFVVSNIFDISLKDENGNIITADKDKKIVITLNLGLSDSDATPLFAHRYSDGNWVVVADNDVVRNADNTVTLTLHGLSAIAVLEHVDSYSVENPEVTSPATGFTAIPYIAAALAVITIALGVVVTKMKKAK